MIIKDFEVVVEGNADADGLFSQKSLCFWGGVDPQTGMIRDIHHPLCGKNLTDQVLCIPYDRGSVSSSGVMLEMVRQGTNPSAILCIEAEAVLALGPIIGEKMYHRSLAIRTIPKEVYESLPEEGHIRFEDDAIIVE